MTNPETDYLLTVLQPAATYSAWLDASHPLTAIRTWDAVTLVAHGTSGANGVVNRRTRGAAIAARKRAIERAIWSDDNGKRFRVSLTLATKHYNEAHGFMHASYFGYRVTRTYL